MSVWRSTRSDRECLVLENERTDHLDRLLHALSRPGVVRRRVAATVGLIMLFFAVLAVAGLYSIALSGLAILVCTTLAVVGMELVRPRRATIALRARETSTAARRTAVSCAPVLRRSARATATAAKQLSHRLPDKERVSVLVDRVVARVPDVRASDATLRVASTARVLLSQSQRASRGARVREALRLNAAGAALRRAGAFAEAAEQHRQALAVFHDLGDRRAAALTKNNLALALERTGDDTALQLFEDAATELGELGDEQAEGQVIANLAVGLRRRGQAERAEDALVRALEKLEQHTPEYEQVDSLRRAS